MPTEKQRLQGRERARRYKQRNSEKVKLAKSLWRKERNIKKAECLMTNCQLPISYPSSKYCEQHALKNLPTILNRNNYNALSYEVKKSTGYRLGDLSRELIVLYALWHGSRRKIWKIRKQMES